jgi:transcription antitermination factor NusG
MVDNRAIKVFHKLMALVKTHIVLDAEKAEAPEARKEVLSQIRKKFDISEVNEKRFERYGVLTCDIEEELLDDVRRIPGVAGVEVDRERYLDESGAKKKK